MLASESPCRMYGGAGERGPAGHGPCFPGGGHYSPPSSYRHHETGRRSLLNTAGPLFGGLNDALLSRAEALVDMGRHGAPPPPPHSNPDQMAYGAAHTVMSAPHTPPTSLPHTVWDMVYGAAPPPPPPPPLQQHRPPPQTPQLPPQTPQPQTHIKQLQLCSAGGLESLELLEPLCPASAPSLPGQSAEGSATPQPPPPHPSPAMFSLPLHPAGPLLAGGDPDSDPRVLEAFSERFKQRRIKLGVTQADVGRALGSLRLPGVGALSQSTICRFESLTLSHNNMMALRPVLHAWLEEAEAQARDPAAPSVLPGDEKKRKRTSIAAAEKRSLEAFFSVQPRPSGDKIAAIAEKLELKKNVVRVWFCNQRQKQKRMKFVALRR